MKQLQKPVTDDRKRTGRTGANGVSERKGSPNALISNHNLHFWTRTSLQTQCPVFIFFLEFWNLRKQTLKAVDTASCQPVVRSTVCKTQDCTPVIPKKTGKNTCLTEEKPDCS